MLDEDDRSVGGAGPGEQAADPCQYLAMAVRQGRSLQEPDLGVDDEQDGIGMQKRVLPSRAAVASSPVAVRRLTTILPAQTATHATIGGSAGYATRVALRTSVR